MLAQNGDIEAKNKEIGVTFDISLPTKRSENELEDLEDWNI
jgi:hypothetical protein